MKAGSTHYRHFLGKAGDAKRGGLEIGCPCALPRPYCAHEFSAGTQTHYTARKHAYQGSQSSFFKKPSKRAFEACAGTAPSYHLLA